MPKPLSEELRPQVFHEMVGQNHLFEPGSFFNRLIQEKKALSLLLWGPPGCGKTTLARLYAKHLGESFHQYSAVSTSLVDLKQLLKKVESHPLLHPRVILFLDEIHRFNKSQQDFFLPYLENGQLVLIGATTENPSFSLNNALLSRMRVLTLQALTDEDLKDLLNRYESCKKPLNMTEDAKALLIRSAHGDGRYLYNLIENCALASSHTLGETDLQKLIQKRAALFDQTGEGHYNLISALHKSIRGSDPDAALYWLARLLNAGESPLFVARRLIRAATEDIGLADPDALTHALNAYKTYQILGSPEGELALASLTVYLALSPKSNAIYKGFKKARDEASQTHHENPPKHILNAPTKLMRDLGYGKGYQYDHDEPHCFSGQNYFPDSFEKRSKYYDPTEIGFEREMTKRLQYFNHLRRQKNTSSH